MSADVITIPVTSRRTFHLRRNGGGGETPPRQRVPDAASPLLAIQARGRPLNLRKQPRQGLFFLLRVESRQRGRERFARKAARGKLALDPRPPVARGQDPHGGLRGAEVVEPSFPLETPGGLPRDLRGEALLLQRADELHPAARANRQEPEAPPPRLLDGIGLPGPDRTR